MNIEYRTNPKRIEDIYLLYESLGWNSFLQLSQEKLTKAMKQSWYVIYAYDKEILVGTGRVVSDGVINAYLCGLGVIPEYRKMGIGNEISNRLVEYCRNDNLHIQLFCEEHLVAYYRKKGFEIFAIGMKVKEQ